MPVGHSFPILLVAALLGAALVGQAPQELAAVPPIPVAEQFVPGADLRVRLAMRRSSLEALENPGFVAIFENMGTMPLHLNPDVAPDIRIYDDQGVLVDPPLTIIAERILRIIADEDLIELTAGETWEVPLPAEYPRQHGDLHYMASYEYTSSRNPAAERGLALRAGRYVARFTYLNAPSYTAHYDIRQVTKVWEGRAESAPIGFAVAAGAEPWLEAWRSQLSRERAWAAAATIPELEQRLGNDDNQMFMAAIDRLVELGSRQSLPALRTLLDDPIPWKRSAAATAIVGLGHADRALLRRLVQHDDPQVVRVALLPLAQECELADAPLFERAVGMGLGEAVSGLIACGSAASFAVFRSLPDARDASAALHALTFVSSPPSATGLTDVMALAEWDAWIAMHADESRDEWAMRAISALPPYDWSHVQAIDYLRRANDRRALPMARRISTDSWYEARIAAARAVAVFERGEGIALLRRELLNRHPDAVRKAIGALNAATGLTLRFDVLLPTERQRALTAYVLPDRSR